jgi:hypothetical protein
LKKTSEKVAQKVIERIFTGSKMIFREKQHESLPDFDLHYPNGVIAVVEVTESVDEDWLATYAAVAKGWTKSAKASKSKYPVRAVKCQKSWAVYVNAKVNLKNLFPRVDEHLAALETLGCRQFPPEREPEDWEAVLDIYDKPDQLGVDFASVVEPVSPYPIIGVLSPGRGGSVSPDKFWRAIEVEAKKGDNIQKLSKFLDRERHLFIYFDSRNILPWRVLVTQKPQLDIPFIPAEITHVWAAAIPDSGDRAIVWRMERNKNWRSLAEVTLPSEIFD